MGLIKKNDIAYGGGGSNLPSGGSTGQVLAKKSNADNDYEWINQSSLPLDVEYVTVSEAESWFN